MRLKKKREKYCNLHPKKRNEPYEKKKPKWLRNIVINDLAMYLIWSTSGHAI